MRERDGFGCGWDGARGAAGAATARNDEARRRASASAPLAPEARCWREAHAIADAKLEATSEAIKWSVITIALLVFLPPVGMFVLIFGGAKQLRAFYRLVLEPKLRNRFIDHEVARQVRADLSRRSSQIEGEHARSMEKLSASIAHEIRNPITAAKSLVQQMGEDPHSRRERRVRARGARGARPRRALDLAPAALRARGGDAARRGALADVDRLGARDACASGIDARAASSCARDVDDAGRAASAIPSSCAASSSTWSATPSTRCDEAQTPSPRSRSRSGENLAGTEVWVRVRDNGPGIDADALARIFEPVLHLEGERHGPRASRSRASCVEAHGGTHRGRRSQPGAGTEFIVTCCRSSPLPRSRSREARAS